jgi:RNA polymerase sigma-70 factor, ECF subfamily
MPSFVRLQSMEQTLVSEQGAPVLDEAAIREFLSGPFPRIVAAIALVAGNRAAAEDAVAEALARAWERADRGDPIDSLPAWVTHVALNLSRSRLRRIRAEARARERIDTQASPPASAEDRMDVRRALGGLPRRQREVIVLHYYLGLPVVEIARALRVTEGTVKSTLFRGRHAMAVALGEEEE